MAITAGVLSQVAVGSNDAQLAATAVTGATGPTTYQWYYSTTTGFTPGGGNIIAGATSLTLDLTGLIPNTVYYAKVKAIDTGHSNDEVIYTQLAFTTQPQTLSQNQFQQRAIVGLVDLPYSPNTKAAEIAETEAGTLYAGAPVKLANIAGGVPKVVACTADSDQVFGFINYNPKNQFYKAGFACEISQALNVIYLYATGAIDRGAEVTLDVLNNGVAMAVGSSGDRIVGWAFDKAVAQGDLIRVSVTVPSFKVA